MKSARKHLMSISGWIDNQAAAAEQSHDESLAWSRIVPFILVHLACFAVFYVGWSPTALVVALLSYLIRMFAITGFYHRYFSHKAFKTSRIVQLGFAFLGASATQRGPLWWAAHHRLHHKRADQADDAHAPHKGFLWSHMGWFLSKKYFATENSVIPDLKIYPELRWLDRYDSVIPVIYAASLAVLGWGLDVYAPALETNALQLFIWGYCIATVLLWHATFSINSLAHKFGQRRYATKDESRNNWFLALITLGEGWHNNHHHYAGAAKQGFYWWELDITYYMLKILESLGLIHTLKTVPMERRQQIIGSIAGKKS